VVWTRIAHNIIAILMGLVVLPLGLGGHCGNQIAMEKKGRFPGIRDAWENLKLHVEFRIVCIKNRPVICGRLQYGHRY
jgi:hypothetical protein